MRLGLIGCGPTGLAHARAAIALGHEITRVRTLREDSPNLKELRKIAPGVEWFGLGKDFRGGLDRIVVAMPWRMDGNYMPALESVAPVLLEKPVAFDFRPPDSAHVIGYNRRFYKTVAAVRERLAKGGLHAVYVTISETSEGRDPALIEYLIEYSSSHVLDLLLHLLGPLDIESAYRANDLGFTHFDGVLETDESAPVFLSMHMDDPVRTSMRFLFDDKTSWVLSPLEALSVYDGWEIVAPKPGLMIRSYIPKMVMGMNEPAEHKPGFLDQMRAFTTGDYSIACTPAQAYRLQQFIAGLKG